MGCSREARESEKRFDMVWNEMRHLCCCVWRGRIMLEEVQEHINSIKKNLDKTIELMKTEEM